MFNKKKRIRALEFDLSTQIERVNMLVDDVDELRDKRGYIKSNELAPKDSQISKLIDVLMGLMKYMGVDYKYEQVVDDWYPTPQPVMKKVLKIYKKKK